jgi:uncharacterized membrane protein
MFEIDWYLEKYEEIFTETKQILMNMAAKEEEIPVISNF